MSAKQAPVAMNSIVLSLTLRRLSWSFSAPLVRNGFAGTMHRLWGSLQIAWGTEPVRIKQQDGITGATRHTYEFIGFVRLTANSRPSIGTRGFGLGNLEFGAMEMSRTANGTCETTGF
jgi:hypothetical protein